MKPHPAAWGIFRATVLLSLAISGTVAAMLGAASLLEPGVSPLFDTVSMLAHGVGGPLVAAALVLAGLGLALLAACFWAAAPRRWQARAGSVGLSVGGSQVLLLALFPTDPTLIPTTVAGLVHAVLSGVGLAVIPLSMLALSWHVGREAAWRGVRTAARWIAGFGLAAALAYGVLSSLHAHSGLPGPFYDGLAERLAIAAILAWAALASVGLWRMAALRLRAQAAVPEAA